MNRNEAQTLADTINEWSSFFPFVNARVSTLSGEESASVMVTISLDPRESWNYGILENSRFVKLAFHSWKNSESVLFRQIAGRIPIKLRGFSDADKPTLYRKLAKIKADLQKQM